MILMLQYPLTGEFQQQSPQLLVDRYKHMVIWIFEMTARINA